MKISIELKDAPRYQRVETVAFDKAVHPNVTVAAVVKASRANRPWCKIIDIRIDLR